MMTNNRPNDALMATWHRTINDYIGKRSAGTPFPHFMYRAMDVADEVPRLALLFEMERTGKLAKRHYQCSHDREGQSVPDNRLTCRLGAECRACPFLLALDKASADLAEIDQMKAWTCVVHILAENGTREHIDTLEGFVLTTDDRMCWNNVYASLAGADE